MEAANTRLSRLWASRAGAFDYALGWRLHWRLREVGSLRSRAEALRSELDTLKQNIVDQNLTGPATELFAGDNGPKLYADWVHLARTIGAGQEP